MSANHQVDDIRRAKGSAATYVKGHKLESEGSPHRCATPKDCVDVMTGYARWDGGHGRCSCGALSPSLHSNNARKAWHRQHKLDVIAGPTS